MPRLLSSSAILTALVLSTTTFGCARSPVPAATGQPVRFALTVDATGFASGAEIAVDVWNRASLAARERQSSCVASSDGTGTRVECPPGVDPAATVTPERFTFTADELASGFTIAALSLKLGEPFEISIAGPASDGCNHAMASARGTVTSLDMTLAELALAQTTMACAPAAG